MKTLCSEILNHIQITSLDWNHALPERLFLEASAGTGKTYAIQHYVVRSILEASRSGEFLDPKNVLVVTFTKAAAYELKVRIQETIESAYDVLSKIGQAALPHDASYCFSDIHHFFTLKNFSYLSSYLFHREDETIPYHILEKRIWELMYALKRFLRDIDVCEISTIHSFLHNAIVGFYQEDLGEIATSNRHLNIKRMSQCHWINQIGLTQWIQNCFIWSLPDSVVYPHEWHLLIKKFSRLQNQGQSLAQDMAYKLSEQKMGLYTSGGAHFSWEQEDIINMRHKSWQEIHGRFQSWLEAFEEKRHDETYVERLLMSWLQMKKGATKKDGMLHPHLLKRICVIVKLLYHTKWSEEWYDEMAVSFSIIDPIVQAEKKKRATSSTSKKFSEEELEVAEEFFSSVWPIIAKTVSVEAIYDRIYRYISSIFISRLVQGDWKTAQSVMETAALMAEEEAEQLFAGYLRNRFHVVVIDEFQDTDPVQWGIFKTVFCEDSEKKRRLLLVGDPKQAIYIFRNADVYTYLNAKSSFRSHEMGSLNKNYRASSQMVRSLNACFSGLGVDSWLFFMPKINKALVCEALESHSTVQPLSLSRNGCSIHFALLSGNKGRKRTWPSDDIEIASVFPWIGHEIEELTQSDGISFNEIAVLVKDRHQAARMEQFFTRIGLPSKTIRVDDITDSPVFTFFIALLKAIEKPTSESCLAQLFLSTKTQGGVETAAKIVSDISLRGECVEVLLHAKKAFYSSGIGKMAYCLKEEPFAYKKTLPEIISEYFGKDIQYLIDFDHLFEIASKLMNVGYTTLSHVIDGFSHLHTLFLDDPEILIRRVENSESSIQIMTMHRSKGLEFPVVFAVGASTRSKEPEENEADIFQEYKKFDFEAEKIRLLYVTLTRAKKRLYIPFVVEESQKIARSGTLSPFELFFACHRAHEKKIQVSDKEMWLNELIAPLSMEDVVQSITRLQGQTEEMAITMSFMEEDLNKRASSPLLESRNRLGTLLFHSEEDLFIRDENQVPTCVPHLKSVCREYVSFSKVQKIIEHKLSHPSHVIQSFSEKPQKEIAHNKKNNRKLFGIRFHALISWWLQQEYDPPLDLQGENSILAESLLYDWIMREFPAWCDMAHELSRTLKIALFSKLPFGEKKISLFELHSSKKALLISEQSFLEAYSTPKKISQDGLKERYLQGTIDLIILYESQLYVIDWKTNKISWNESGLSQFIIDSGYHLQASLYSDVAKRYVDSHPACHWGGFYLVFLDAIQSADTSSEPIQEVGMYFCETEKTKSAYSLIMHTEKAPQTMNLHKGSILSLPIFQVPKEYQLGAWKK